MSNSVSRRGWLAVFLMLLLVATMLPFTSNASSTSGLMIRKHNQEFLLSAQSLGTFHRTTRAIQNARLIQVPNSQAQLLSGKASGWPRRSLLRHQP